MQSCTLSVPGFKELTSRGMIFHELRRSSEVGSGSITIW